MEGVETEKERMKSKKRGTTTLPCSLGENRLQRSRFRLGRTIICTHEQTAKPTIHALADPSCRHIFACRARPPTHRLSWNAIFAHLDLPTSICPPRSAHLDMAWHGMAWHVVVAFAIMSDPICPQRDLRQVDSS